MKAQGGGAGPGRNGEEGDGSTGRRRKEGGMEGAGSRGRATVTVLATVSCAIVTVPRVWWFLPPSG